MANRLLLLLFVAVTAATGCHQDELARETVRQAHRLGARDGKSGANSFLLLGDDASALPYLAIVSTFANDREAADLFTRIDKQPVKRQRDLARLFAKNYRSAYKARTH